MKTADEQVRKLARRQRGVFTRDQARSCGLDPHHIRYRIRCGEFTRLGHRTFLVAGAPVTPAAELQALVLDIGGPILVAGQTAATLHRINEQTLRPPFELAVPRGRCLNRPNADVRRIRDLARSDCTTVKGFPVLNAVRTLIELAESETSARLATLLDNAIRDRRITERALQARIIELRTQGRAGLPMLDAVLGGHEVTRGGQSYLERLFLRSHRMLVYPGRRHRPS